MTNAVTILTFSAHARTLAAALTIAALTPTAIHAETSGEAAISSTPHHTVREHIDGRVSTTVTARNYVVDASAPPLGSDIPLLETPQSLSIVTRDQIDFLNHIDVEQASRFVAGVAGEHFGPDLRYNTLRIRGLSPSLYIDGLPVPVSTAAFDSGVDLYGFEGVEFHRGPTSVLNGPAQPAGMYNLVSRRPSDDFGGELAFRYGSDHFYQGYGTMTGALGRDVSARFTGLYRSRELLIQLMEAERVLLSPTISIETPWAMQITLLGHYQWDRTKGDPNDSLPVQGSLLANPLGKIDFSTNLGEFNYNLYRREQYAVGWQIVQPLFEGWRFENRARWFDYEELQNGIYGNGLAADNRTVARLNSAYVEDVDQLAIDNRIHGEFATGDIAHRFTIGLDYRNLRNDADRGFGGALPIDLFEPAYGIGAPFTPPATRPFVDLEQEQTGVYAQGQMRFGSFGITLGGRHDWVDTRDLLRNISRDDEDFSFQLGADYAFESGLTPYVSYATSFAPTYGQDRFGNLFLPSTSEQIEAGLRYARGRPGDDVRIYASAAIYSLDQDNVLTRDTSLGAQLFDRVQIGQVETQGIELEASARIDDQLTLNASYTYLDAEISQSIRPLEISNRPVLAPRHNLTAFADYTFRRSGIFSGFGFGVGVRHMSGSFGDNANMLRMPSTTLLDAILHYDLPDWRVSFNATNILNRIYAGRCATPANCRYGMDRQVRLSITRKF